MYKKKGEAQPLQQTSPSKLNLGKTQITMKNAINQLSQSQIEVITLEKSIQDLNIEAGKVKIVLYFCLGLFAVLVTAGMLMF